jgi:hypothetical protein
MGKTPQHHCWPEAMRLCRLNRSDVEMAKRLGFLPDALIRARPGPKQKWKLPVNEWVRELYRERFGHVLGQKPLPAPVPVEVGLDQEAMRRFEEQLYWEDYWARNEDDTRPKKRKGSQAKPAKAPGAGAAPCQHQGIGYDAVPFLGNSRPTELRDVGRSVEPLRRLMPRPAACALPSHEQTKDSAGRPVRARSVLRLPVH